MTSSPIENNVCHAEMNLHENLQDSCTNVCHTRATVTALLKFLYIWMPYHLVDITAMLVCVKCQRQSYKVSGSV